MNTSPLTDLISKLIHMSTLKERMEELATATGWDTGKIAEEAGVSSSAVSQWFGRGSKIIHSINIKPAIYLERSTGFSAMWLSKGELPKMASNPQKRLSPMAYGLGVLFDSIPESDSSKRDQVFAAVLQLSQGLPELQPPIDQALLDHKTQKA